MAHSNMNLVPLLDYIDPDESYQIWEGVGMALKHEGYTVETWAAWSRRGPKFHEGECERKWESFKEETEKPITGAYITMLAQQKGWKATGGNITIDDFNDDPPAPFREPGDNWNPAADLLKYLKTLFRGDDYINITTEGIQDKKGKYRPTKGKYYQAGELCKKLESWTSFSPESESGAWVCINPTDGKGRKNENITAFRYALIESDEISIDEQLRIIKALNLPVATLVFAGRKSVHAAVKIDASNADEYAKRVKYLYEVCRKQGFSIDEQNKNPARLTRLPGVIRGDHKQFLIATNTGAASWNAWIKWIEENITSYPPSAGLDEVYDSPPPLSPVLIHGLLRQNERMMIAGESKAGKSFLAIELTIALATGRPWLNHETIKTPVLYMNLEITGPSCIARFLDVCQAIQIDGHIPYIKIWNLRDEPLDHIVSGLLSEIRRIKRENNISIGCIVIDPIYILNRGDENSAKDTTDLLLQFAAIGRKIGAAIVFIHHYSKGAAMYSNALNRASGSSVFGRFVDTSVSVNRLEPPKYDPSVDPKRKAFRIALDVRTFPPQNDIYAYFDPPVHTVDTSGTLAKWADAGTRAAGQKKGREKQSHEKQERQSFIRVNIESGTITTLKEFSERTGVEEKTIRNDIKQMTDDNGEPLYIIKKGIIYTREQLESGEDNGK